MVLVLSKKLDMALSSRLGFLGTRLAYPDPDPEINPEGARAPLRRIEL